ncbi:molybdopterin-guanine dinucleotide biosynthesis protein MobB [Helicobacter cinaedi]|uniref:molybdopterin-guanine dinucleotide biosynthesis protein MobB n=1 Tax=Helicobacter cinaedi TaxID=213 RepID=UPI001F201342|nr:molybdopterin-guanine dinucleotide biosynthesis protein B [Helicobacter cinaedi]BDB66545.1 molybdopterin-guanine dinucleotide biosynthesis protein MobB [Helicobacter cinaedi]
MQVDSKPIIFAFSGKSNSGKTTLICKLSEYFKARGARVAIFKHDPKDKAIFDTQGKDSYKFFQTADAVALISPTRSVLQVKNAGADSKNFQDSKDSQNSADIQAFYETMELFKDYDFIFIEGLKTLPFKRIVVARESVESTYIPYADAFAIDESVSNANIVPSHIPTLNLNDVAQIANFILQSTTKDTQCKQ